MEKAITLTKKQFYEIGAKAMAERCAFMAKIGFEKQADTLAEISAELIEVIGNELFKEGEKD